MLLKDIQEVSPGIRPRLASEESERVLRCDICASNTPNLKYWRHRRGVNEAKRAVVEEGLITGRADSKTLKTMALGEEHSSKIPKPLARDGR